MHITLIDDSLPFDGFSPANRPLGGAEKAFASLPGALVRRGHKVHVYNRARFPLVVEGADWETLDHGAPGQTDVLIAFRQPSLLGAVRQAGGRVLWATAPGHRLEVARKALESYRPAVVFQGAIQRQGFDDLGDLPLSTIPPGVRNDFLADMLTELAPRPTAVVTTHPAHGLSALLGLWQTVIRPAVPEARLVVVSALLDKGRSGGEIPDTLRPVFAQAMAAAEDGVEIVAPHGDAVMARLYHTARVHLYPGHAEDMGCWTLAESQACGLPAVAYGLGAVRERIRDGETGQIVPDAAAMGNLAIRLLTDDDVFWAMNRDARLLQASRTWDLVAAEFDAVLKAAVDSATGE